MGFRILESRMYRDPMLVLEEKQEPEQRERPSQAQERDEPRAPYCRGVVQHRAAAHLGGVIPARRAGGVRDPASRLTSVRKFRMIVCWWLGVAAPRAARLPHETWRLTRGDWVRTALRERIRREEPSGRAAVKSHVASYLVASRERFVGRRGACCLPRRLLVARGAISPGGLLAAELQALHRFLEIFVERERCFCIDEIVIGDFDHNEFIASLHCG